MIGRTSLDGYQIVRQIDLKVEVVQSARARILDRRLEGEPLARSNFLGSSCTRLDRHIARRDSTGSGWREQHCTEQSHH
jgi:hypothetical protein